MPRKQTPQNWLTTGQDDETPAPASGVLRGLPLPGDPLPPPLPLPVWLTRDLWAELQEFVAWADKYIDQLQKFFFLDFPPPGVSIIWSEFKWHINRPFEQVEARDECYVNLAFWIHDNLFEKVDDAEQPTEGQP